MRTIRFDDELEHRLTEASQVSGQTVSEIVRQGAAKRCDEILGETLYDKVKDIIGSGASTASARRRTDVKHTGRAFARLLAEDEKRKRRR